MLTLLWQERRLYRLGWRHYNAHGSRFVNIRVVMNVKIVAWNSSRTRRLSSGPARHVTSIQPYPCSPRQRHLS